MSCEKTATETVILSVHPLSMVGIIFSKLYQMAIEEYPKPELSDLIRLSLTEMIMYSIEDVSENDYSFVRFVPYEYPDLMAHMSEIMLDGAMHRRNFFGEDNGLGVLDLNQPIYLPKEARMHSKFEMAAVTSVCCWHFETDDVLLSNLTEFLFGLYSHSNKIELTSLSEMKNLEQQKEYDFDQIFKTIKRRHSEDLKSARLMFVVDLS